MKRLVSVFIVIVFAVGGVLVVPVPVTAACILRSGVVNADGTTYTVGGFSAVSGQTVTLVATNNSGSPATTVTLNGYSSNSGTSSATTTFTFASAVTFTANVEGTGGGTIRWTISTNGLNCTSFRRNTWGRGQPTPWGRWAPHRFFGR